VRKLRETLALALAAAVLSTPLGCGKSETNKRADAHDHAEGESDEHAEEAPSKAEHAEEGEHDDHEKGDEHAEEGAEAVRLSAEQLTAAGIRIAEAGPGAIDSGTELLGEVHPNGDRLAHITPRFPGIVREVRKHAGDLVRAGDVLAVIESSDSLAPYSLKTAIDGVVLEKHLTRGEAVDREKQAFVVADLRSVWVDLAVYQKDLGRLAIGQRVRIHAVGEGPDAEGAISYLTPAVDRMTRTATARVVLENAERKFLPGMFVTAHTLEAGEATVAVPRDAVQSFEGQPSVFVETDAGLAPRPVTLGREGDSRIEIVSGLAAGERIAVTNTFLLKAELAKAEAEHEH
jgi:cobalt-zinc-cadmium efflux system membrane fusion protein